MRSRRADERDVSNRVGSLHCLLRVWRPLQHATAERERCLHRVDGRPAEQSRSNEDPGPGHAYRLPDSTNLPGEEFTYSFTNGIVFPDHIEFGKPFVPPVPDQASFGFVISNSVDAISLNGIVVVPCVGCADVPEEFQHTNVMAVLMPADHDSRQRSRGVLEHRLQPNLPSAIPPHHNHESWTDLGLPVAGKGSINCHHRQSSSGETRALLSRDNLAMIQIHPVRQTRCVAHRGR